jgi:cytochrome P450
MPSEPPGAPLSDPDSYRGGHPAVRYDEIRNACPVSWQLDAGGYWAVTSHSEIVEVSSDPSRFASAAGFKLKDDTYARLGADIDAAMSGTILKLDPPMHGLIRFIAAPFFSPASIHTWEPRYEPSPSSYSIPSRRIPRLTSCEP